MACLKISRRYGYPTLLGYASAAIFSSNSASMLQAKHRLFQDQSGNMSMLSALLSSLFFYWSTYLHLRTLQLLLDKPPSCFALPCLAPLWLPSRLSWKRSRPRASRFHLLWRPLRIAFFGQLRGYLKCTIKIFTFVSAVENKDEKINLCVAAHHFHSRSQSYWAFFWFDSNCAKIVLLLFRKTLRRG